MRYVLHGTIHFAAAVDEVIDAKSPEEAEEILEKKVGETPKKNFFEKLSLNEIDIWEIEEGDTDDHQ